MSFSTTTAMRVAEYIITKSYENRTPVSNLKLQKLLYFVQGQAIKVYGERAFTESIEAWDYGPVVRSVYLKFRIFGAGPICRAYPIVSLTDETKDLIDEVINRYNGSSAWDLVQLTHVKGTPWSDAIDSGSPTISIDSMYKYFRNADE